MKAFLDENEQLIRFVLLTCGLLMLAGAGACFVLGNALLAVACSIVSAWSLGFYLDTVWAGIIRASRERPVDEHRDDCSGI
ncbi:MAG: hypothetical protein R3C45_11435 [Phycisphaerales bacterium]